ncbi:MAG: MBL fold metallo-hydrolase [Planctomycetes bacterium]|nr:MBL fold metallo-hydrolase [Planctomycetota bacterium]
MRVRFWGARGSFVAAGPQFVRYGGNTSCVELTEGEHRLILDLGSGAIPLGRTLPGKRTHVLLSHTHIDHIQGFPFFAPVFNPAAKLVIHGPRGAGKKIERVLDESLNPDYSPLYSLSNLSAKLDFQHLGEEPLVIDAFDVTCAALPHGRTVSWGFRVEGGTGTVAYLTDVEYSPQGIPESAISLARDADLLIHDATYTPDDYPPRAGWGHCSWEHALALAERAGAKRLALFHHAPDRTDDEVDVLVAMARNAAGKGTAVIAAMEGDGGVVEI